MSTHLRRELRGARSRNSSLLLRRGPAAAAGADHPHARNYAYQAPTHSSPTPESSSSSSSSSSASKPTTTSTYRSPSLPTSPSSYSSSGLPDSAHPMPEDMPREDYAAPTAYTMSMLGRIIRYIVYGVIGVGVSSVLGVEGLHQYVEKVALAYPSHSPYLDVDRADNSTIPTTSASYIAWTEDPWNGSWTGSPLSGGTSPTLSWQTRHALRSAWVAFEWGAGSTGSSMISMERRSLHGGGGQTGLKGMIGQRPAGAQGTGTVNKVDTGFAIAEAYLSAAIELAQNKDRIEFPPHLSVTRSEYPEMTLASSASGAQRPNRVAVDMLLRHAEVLERIGMPQTLHKASETYERVLRSLVTSSSRSDYPDSTILASTSNGEMLSVQTLSEDLHEAERNRLTQKISDIHARMGDLRGARGWSEWGVKRLGLTDVGIHVRSELVDLSGLKGLKVGKDEAAKSAGWFAGIFRGSKSSPSDDEGAKIFGSELDLAATQTTPAPTARLARTPSPALLRSIISLLSSHSTHLAMSGDLASAAIYQTTALDLINSADTSGTVPASSSASPDATLHRLWLSQRKSLTGMHLAEVDFARGQDQEAALSALVRSCAEGEEVIRELTTGRRARPHSVTAESGSSGALQLGKMTEIRPAPVASVFASKSPAGSGNTLKPAQRLLRDAQRSTAENWSLLGLLYERRAQTPIGFESSTQDQSHHLQETALDCYERAIGWSKVAHGGSFSGGVSGDEADELGTDGSSTGYQRSFERLRARMEAGMKSDKVI